VFCGTKTQFQYSEGHWNILQVNRKSYYPGESSTLLKINLQELNTGKSYKNNQQHGTVY
jgi:hypothetical protein